MSMILLFDTLAARTSIGGAPGDTSYPYPDTPFLICQSRQSAGTWLTCRCQYHIRICNDIQFDYNPR